MSAGISPSRRTPRPSAGRQAGKSNCDAVVPISASRRLEILSNAVDRLEGAARVAHILSKWAQDGTKLSAFHELAQQLPLEVLVLKAVRDELLALDREGRPNA